MLKGQKISKQTTVQLNTQENRHFKSQTQKSPLKHYATQSKPTFKEADMFSNKPLVQQAAMAKHQTKQRQVQDQVHGTYFKREQVPTKDTQGQPSTNKVSGQPFEYYSLRTQQIELKRVEVDMVKSPAVNSNKQRGRDVQISPVRTNDGNKTTKAPFRRKAAYFKNISRGYSSSSGVNRESSGSREIKNRTEVIQSQEREKVFSQSTSVSKAQDDRSSTQQKNKKQFPAPLPQPSKHDKTTPIQKVNKLPKKNAIVAKSQTELEMAARKERESPSLQQLANFIINNKPPTVLKPKHLEISPKELPPTQTELRVTNNSQTSMRRKDDRPSNKKSSDQKHKRSIESISHKQSTDKPTDKADKRQSRSRKRTQEQESKKVAAQVRQQELLEDEQKQHTWKSTTTIEFAKNNKIPESALKKFAAYRTRLFNKQAANFASQKLLYRTHNKQISGTLYTPSLTLRRTQQLSGKLQILQKKMINCCDAANQRPFSSVPIASSSAHSAKEPRIFTSFRCAPNDEASNLALLCDHKLAVMNQNPSNRKMEVSPHEPRRDKKHRPYDLYKHATQTLAQQNDRACSTNDRDNSTNSKHPVSNTPTADAVQRSLSNRSHALNSKSKSKDKRKKLPKKKIVQTATESEYVVNVQIRSNDAKLKSSDDNNTPSSIIKRTKPEKTDRSEKSAKPSEKPKPKKQSASTDKQEDHIQIPAAPDNIYFEPMSTKFFDQKPNESIKTSHASPVKTKLFKDKNKKKLDMCKQKILSLVEMQKLRAKRMKALRNGQLKLKMKTEAAIKIQRWFRSLLEMRRLSTLKALMRVIQEPVVDSFCPSLEQSPNTMLQVQSQPSQPSELEQIPDIPALDQYAMSSTQRVQNLIKQKIEKRQREAQQDSYILQPLSIQEKQSPATPVKQQKQPNLQAQETEALRKSGLILVNRLQAEGPELWQSSRQNCIQFNVKNKPKQDCNTSVTLSRMMLEESLNMALEKKQSYLENDEKQNSVLMNSSNAEERQRIADVTETMKILTLDLTPVSPILNKHYPQTPPLMEEKHQRDNSEETKSNQGQSKLNVASDVKMRRFEEKFPTPQQIFRVSSQNSLQTSHRNHDFYNALPNSAQRPSKLIYTGTSGSSILAQSQISSNNVIGSNIQSPDRHNIVSPKTSSHDVVAVSPVDYMPDLNDESRVDVRVEDQRQNNDSQQSFQNDEDSKSEDYSEAPFEKSQREIHRLSQGTSNEDNNGLPDPVQVASSPSLHQEQPESAESFHNESQEPNEDVNQNNVFSQQQEQVEVENQGESQHAPDEKDQEQHSDSDLEQEDPLSQQTSLQSEQQQENASPHENLRRSSLPQTEQSQHSNSFTDSAAPCSGDAGLNSGRRVDLRVVQDADVQGDVSREVQDIASPQEMQKQPEQEVQVALPSHEIHQTHETSQILEAEMTREVKELKDTKEDIDLQEKQKANDLATLKLQICNELFEQLVNEIKTDLFPTRQMEEDQDIANDANRATELDEAVKVEEEQQQPIVPIKSEQEAIKSLRVDEKQINYKKTPNPDKPASASAQQRGRLHKHSSSSTLPVIKFNKNGEPLPVSFERFKTGQSFFKQLKTQRFTKSVDFRKFMSDYFLIKPDSENADQTKNKQAVNSFQFHSIEVTKQEMHDHFTNQLAKNEKELKSKLARKKLGASSLKQEDELVLNLRGIKTSTDVAEQYVENLFECLLQNEAEFLDSLATPFVQNPLTDLQQITKRNKQAREIEQRLKLPDLSKDRENGQNTLEQSSCQDLQDEGSLQQQPVLSVEIYLDIERRKEYVLLADSVSEIDESHLSGNTKPELIEQQSMLAEWENIHNKVIFDAVNDALDEYRPYGLKGPPALWSGQTRALTYRFSQNAREVLTQVREKVLGLSKTFGGALANSELLKEYHIKGPLEPDKLIMLREERLAIMMIQDCEDCQRLWEDTEHAETGVKFELADLILDQLVQECVAELQAIQ